MNQCLCLSGVGGADGISYMLYALTMYFFFPLQQESKEESELQKKRSKQQPDRSKFTAKRKIARRSQVWGWESGRVLSSFCCLSSIVSPAERL